VPPDRGVDVDERRLIERRRTVDEHIAAPEPLEHRGPRRPGRFLRRQVAHDLPDTVEHDRPMAVPPQGVRDRRSDRLGTAGDDGDPARIGFRRGDHLGGLPRVPSAARGDTDDVISEEGSLAAR
jgi:hypothetical protein